MIADYILIWIILAIVETALFSVWIQSMAKPIAIEKKEEKKKVVDIPGKYLKKEAAIKYKNTVKFRKYVDDKDMYITDELNHNSYISPNDFAFFIDCYIGYKRTFIQLTNYKQVHDLNDIDENSINVLYQYMIPDHMGNYLFLFNTDKYERIDLYFICGDGMNRFLQLLDITKPVRIDFKTGQITNSGTWYE